MSDTLPNPDAQLDARGLFCPEPVMMLHNAVRDLGAGECLEVLATDPSTQRDIPRFFKVSQLLSQVSTYHLHILRLYGQM